MNKSAIEQFFNPYADDPQSFRKLAITVQAIILFAVLGITFFVDNKPAMLTLAAWLAVTILLSRANKVWPAQIFTPLSILIISTLFMLEGSGTHDIAMIGLAGAIVVAGLFLGAQGLIGFTFLAIAVFITLSLAEMSGRFNPTIPVETLPEEPIISAFILAAISLSLITLINRLRRIADNARENELAQITANQELLQLKNSLETRVTERTAELEHRAAQFELVSSVARSITVIQDLDQLLPSICQLMSERFGFYHTGLFLLDERAEYAVLQATNSEGGRQMLERGRRLRVGMAGIVGYVAGQGKPRVALDVGADAVYFNNPDLPTTRSEMALPLQIGSRVIGVLDAQSEEVNAFNEDDIAVLGILANQVAVAIENARLFSQTRATLSESQTVYQQYFKQDWVRFTQTLKHHGYTYDGIKTSPLDENLSELDAEGLTIPVKIRGLVIGNVLVRSNNPLRQWTQDEINLAQAAADRAGLAIENVRLLSEAQRRAAKERTIGEITSRIGASINMSAIMQTAVEELGRTLPGSEVILQFREQG